MNRLEPLRAFQDSTCQVFSCEVRRVLTTIPRRGTRVGRLAAVRLPAEPRIATQTPLQPVWNVICVNSTTLDIRQVQNLQRCLPHYSFNMLETLEGTPFNTAVKPCMQAHKGLQKLISDASNAVSQPA